MTPIVLITACQCKHTQGVMYISGGFTVIGSDYPGCLRSRAARLADQRWRPDPDVPPLLPHLLLLMKRQVDIDVFFGRGPNCLSRPVRRCWRWPVPRRTGPERLPRHSGYYTISRKYHTISQELIEPAVPRRLGRQPSSLGSLLGNR